MPLSFLREAVAPDASCRLFLRSAFCALRSGIIGGGHWLVGSVFLLGCSMVVGRRRERALVVGAVAADVARDDE